jgi:hypothetical protein
MNHRSPQKNSSTRTSRGQRGSGRCGHIKGGARHSPTRSPLHRGGCRPYKPPTDEVWDELYKKLKEWMSSIQIEEPDQGIFWPVNTPENVPFDIFKVPSDDMYTLIDNFMQTQMIDSKESATIKCNRVIHKIRTRIIQDFLPKFKYYRHQSDNRSKKEREFFYYFDFGFLTPIIQLGIKDLGIRNLYTQLSVLELWNSSTKHGGKLAINKNLETIPEINKIIQAKSCTFDEYCRLIKKVYHCKEVLENAKNETTWIGVTDRNLNLHFRFKTYGTLFFVYGLMSEKGYAMYPFDSFPYFDNLAWDDTLSR